jgi:DNA-binding XRE family transcriptional regulator
MYVILCLCNIARCWEAAHLAYSLVMTAEVRAWLHDLRRRDRPGAIQVGQAIGMLLEAGPELGLPLADRIQRSRLSNLKELRPGSAGRSEIRILYIFDPRRNAVLLVAGEQGREVGRLVPPGDPAGRAALRGLPQERGHQMSTEFHHYNRDEFAAEFYPDPADKEQIAAGMEQLRAEQRAYRLAEMRRRLGITQADVATRMGVTQGRVSAIEHARPGATELRTLAAYVEALGGRLEIIADFGDQRLAFTEPGNEAA